MDTFKLTDNSISHIAQLLQVAILTGTDVIDNMRAIDFVLNKGSLELSPEYFENFEAGLQRMLEETENLAMIVTGKRNQLPSYYR